MSGAISPDEKPEGAPPDRPDSDSDPEDSLSRAARDRVFDGLLDSSPIEKMGRQSVADTVDATVEFIKRRLVSLAADHVIPVVGGRIVDVVYEAADLMASIRAATSEDPVLDVPLPSPIPGFDFTLELPLAGDEARGGTPRLGLCVAPSSPSLTGGWAFDSPEHDEPADSKDGRAPEAEWPLSHVAEQELDRDQDQDEPIPPPTDTSLASPDALRSGFTAGRRSAAAYIVEADLGSLPLLSERALRARQLQALADAFAPQARTNPGLRRFEVLVITDQSQRCGLWVWLNDGSVFTREEREYLAGQHLGRMTTVGPDGQPLVTPATFRYSTEHDAIEIGGLRTSMTQKVRDVRHTGRAAIVVDDVLSPGHPRKVEVRGTAEVIEADGKAFGDDYEDVVIRIHPRHVTSIGINPGTHHASGRSA